MERDWFECIRQNDVETIEKILNTCKWIKVNDLNRFGEIALHIAASKGHVETIQLLLQHGANLVALDKESGWTPLHRSLYNGHLIASLVLLRYGGKKYGKKAIHQMLYDILDKNQQNCMQVLSICLRDEFEERCRAMEDDFMGQLTQGGRVFSFGKADFQLGYHLPQADVQFTPRAVAFSMDSPIVQIDAGKYHTLAVNARGKCFSWGFGKGGRLGTGKEFDHVEPIQIQVLNTFAIIKVAAGENHSLAISSSGQVFSWGSNSFGQLGQNVKTFSHESRLVPMRIEALRSHFIMDIAASSCHSAAITSSGDVFTWGSNKKGQLGRKEGFGTDQPYPIPKRVDALVLHHPQTAIYEDYTFAQAKKVAVSEFHTCVILRVEKSHLQQLGSYGQVWQFGYGSKIPSRVGLTPSSGNWDGMQERARGIVDAWIPSWKKPFVDIVQVACARQHSIALCSAGNVYTWGHNSNVVTSSTSNNSGNICIASQTPGSSQQVTGVLLQCGPVVSINGAQDHCAVVTREGDLYTWGSGVQGVLGHGKGITWQPQPQRVKYLKKVVAVATGSQHTCVLTAPIHDISYSNSRVSSCAAYRPDADDMEDDDVNPEDLFDVLQGIQSSEVDSDSDEDTALLAAVRCMNLQRKPLEQCHKPSHLSRARSGPIPSLFDLCQRNIATYLDVSTAPLVLKYAEWIQANNLIKKSQNFLRLNLDQLLEKAQDTHKLERLFESLLPESILSEHVEAETDQLPSILLRNRRKSRSDSVISCSSVTNTPKLSPKDAPVLEEMKPMAPLALEPEEKLEEDKEQDVKEDVHVEVHQSDVPVVMKELQTQNSIQSSGSKKKKGSKFVSLESFFTKKTPAPSSSPPAFSSSSSSFLCPWGASPTVSTLPTPQLPPTISSLIGGKSSRTTPSASRTSVASSASSWAPASSSSGAGKSFSLEDLLVATTKKKVSKKQSQKELEQNKFKGWGAEVVPSTSSSSTSSSSKTLLDIQKEEEAKRKKAEEVAAASKIDKWSRRAKLSTVNSWGLCESTEGISLAEVQKNQEYELELQKKREEEELKLVLEVVARAEAEELEQERRQQQKQQRRGTQQKKKEPAKEKKASMDEKSKKKKVKQKKGKENEDNKEPVAISEKKMRKATGTEDQHNKKKKNQHPEKKNTGSSSNPLLNSAIHQKPKRHVAAA